MTVFDAENSSAESSATSVRRLSEAEQTIVIYRLGSLGDTIVALPCFHAIQRAFPHARRVALTNFPVSSKAAPLETILTDGGFIHGSVRYPVGTRQASRLMSLAKELRALKAKTLIYMAGGRGMGSVRRDLMFFRLCGFEQIIGAPSRREDDRGRTGRDGLHEPEAERLTRCLKALGPIDLRDRSLWDLRLTRSEHEAAHQILAPLSNAPFIAVNLGGKDPSKDWGEDNWTALLSQLGPQLDGYGLLFVGGGDDAARAQRLIGLWPGRAVDACGRLSPRESAAALSRAALFVGHDSGPMHLAAAAQIRCVALFGGLNPPRKWHPFGDGHAPLHEPRGVTAIPVHDVGVAVMATLAQSNR